MNGLLGRTIACVVLAAGINVAEIAISNHGAEAAQAWYCTCKGKTKRFLASTRHCENQFSIKRPKTCSRAQWAKVYGPACIAEGCKLK